MEYFLFLTSKTIFEFMLQLDIVIAEKLREMGCPHECCGGNLYVANFVRAGFGVPEGSSPTSLVRHSFTCGKCKRRTTAHSLRWMYYRHFANGIELVMQYLHRLKDTVTLTKLANKLGVPLYLLPRWRKWWQEQFIGSQFWHRQIHQVTGLIEQSGYGLFAHFIASSSPDLTDASEILRASQKFLARFRSSRLWRLFPHAQEQHLSVDT